METQLDTCWRVSGPVVNLAASTTANAVTLYTVSTYASMLGTRAIVPKKLRVQNLAGGNQWLYLGTGIAGGFAAAFPGFYVINNLDNIWQELELPRVTFITNLTAYVAAIAVGGAFNIQLEVEENG